MRIHKLSVIFSLGIISSMAYAGTINAPFYFNQDCIAKVKFKPLPKKLTFTCTQDGKCFTNDMTLNDILLCAQPFGSEEIKTISTQSYYLSQQGWKVKK